MLKRDRWEDGQGMATLTGAGTLGGVPWARRHGGYEPAVWAGRWGGRWLMAGRGGRAPDVGRGGLAPALPPQTKPSAPSGLTSSALRGAQALVACPAAFGVCLACRRPPGGGRRVARGGGGAPRGRGRAGLRGGARAGWVGTSPLREVWAVRMSLRFPRSWLASACERRRPPSRLRVTFGPAAPWVPLREVLGALLPRPPCREIVAFRPGWSHASPWVPCSALVVSQYCPQADRALARPWRASYGHCGV